MKDKHIRTLWKCKLYDNSGWIIGFVAGVHSKGYYVVPYYDSAYRIVDKIKVYNCTECRRFTGLYDKYGFPIFENDTIENKFGNMHFTAKIEEKVKVVPIDNNTNNFNHRYMIVKNKDKIVL